MNNKYQFYADLTDFQSEKITESVENWTQFLQLSGRLYKYPFDEQVLIHAQKPNATAVAPLKIWNKPMNRYVRRGSKGIALLDNKDGRQKLKYVFDVA